MFLQGQAVDWLCAALERTGDARALQESVDWWVCIGSWRRRAPHAVIHDRIDDLPAPLRAASLPQWIERTVPDRTRGGDPEAGHELLFLVEQAPDGEHDRIETLEPILAAAALERDVAVLVRGAGGQHLVGPGGEAWDQLTDFELAPVFVLDASDEEGTALDRGRAIDAARAARLCDEAATMIAL